MEMLTKVPDGEIYVKTGDMTVFHQLARKIEMDHVSQDEYWAWLDRRKADIGDHVHGAKLVEKPDARMNPPLNTAIYYDTPDLSILPTGALLRTSCNKITHAFCAFKAPEDGHGVRQDNRYVFAGEDKRTIQQAPSAPESVEIVRALMRRADIDHPGRLLQRVTGISPLDLSPAILLDDLRYTFYAWLDGRDALRCSIDRAHVRSLRPGTGSRDYLPVTEVEIAIYPRVSPDTARDPRLVELVDYLARDLTETFRTRVTRKIKYQRSATALQFAWSERNAAQAS
jgi:hypothetical protein